MKRTMFTAATRSGKFDYYYYDNGTYTYRDGRQRYHWRFQDGKVECRTSKEVPWVVDVKSVQEAYSNYLAKLVLEET